MKKTHFLSSFPRLSEFARGYLTEDVVPEHGNVHAAALAYLADVPDSERPELLQEVSRIRIQSRALSIAELNHELAKLGSKWTFDTADDFEQLLRTLERGR